ncbi:NAD-dependent epimerase/dehydratase family protein [Planomonospora sp. ID67723]|uniref:NAD-dependent epimerase/dehydratase family protein n=1 Tax=Planomonospora sp. ID67723 TaxID=2738134 RepID=UPI0018C3BF40|nr:NAD-dependent epimerase/dehydratase family protein [Planomonospora sp. ID67723]MBG0826446.1 NAD-dependent epimerase/dehydratase family protein [Planomonospora sp. ID67723]
MRVLVTGASGFVGSHAVAALLAAGHEPLLLVRDPDRTRRILGRVGVVEPVPLHRADIRDAAAVRAGLERCEAVVHAAAEIGVVGRADDLAGTNVAGLRNVLGQAAELGLDPIVHVSTVAVFVPPAGPVITAGSPLSSPRSAYGRSKVSGELYARELAGRGVPVTIVYPGGVVGPHQPSLDALMEGLRAGLDQGWPITSGGVGVVDVRDLATVLARVLEPGRGARRFMLGGHFLTWAQLADVCDEVTGGRCRRYGVPGRLLLGVAAVLDLLKRVRPFGYPLTRDAAEMMTTMVPADDEPTLAELKVDLRPVRESVADAIRWLAEEGHLAPAKAGRLADGAVS